LRVVTILITLLALCTQSFAFQTSTTAKKKQSSKKSTRSKSSTTKSAAPTSTTHRTTSKTSKSKTSKKAPTTYRRSTQQQPTVERYKEIQQALASKGYFNGPVDGTWGPSSIDALKKFQRDQNLTEDGKIGSLSLLALGLGPKRMARAESSPEKPIPQ
jgi:peptidoglycan hydrolase-like protein with peptidoglycan-binding domain